MEEPASILVVSSLEDDWLRFRRAVGGIGMRLSYARTCARATELVASDAPAVIVSDSELGDGDWRQLLTTIGREPRSPCFLVILPAPDPTIWAEAYNLRAWDVLVRPLDTEQIRITTSSALESYKRHSATAQRFTA